MLPGFWTTVEDAQHFSGNSFFWTTNLFQPFLYALSPLPPPASWQPLQIIIKKKTTTGGHEQGAPAARGDTCSFGRKTCLAVTYSRRSRTLHTRGRHMARWWSPLEAQAHDCEVSFPLPASHMERRQETINDRILAAAMNYENDDILKHMKLIEMIVIIQWNQYFFLYVLPNSNTNCKDTFKINSTEMECEHKYIIFYPRMRIVITGLYGRVVEP